MKRTISAVTRRRLDIQGLESVSDERLAKVAPWWRLAFAVCTAFAILGTIAASPIILGILVVIASLGAAFPVHPFDLIYNYGIRHLRGTPPLPRRGAPTRFACGLGACCLAAAAAAFQAGHTTAGYALGGMIIASATLVSTTDICLPSRIYRTLFGWPEGTRTTADAAA